MVRNKVLGRYDIKYNAFSDKGRLLNSLIIGIKFLTEVLAEHARTVFEVEISERVDKEVLLEFREKLALNKPKKKKKKGKGKKKKKKWFIK